MTESADDSIEKSPRGIARLGKDFWSSFRTSLFGWISAAAIAGAVGWFGLQKDKIRDYRRDRQAVEKNIPIEEAFKIAKRSVNGGVLWAVPFRNRSDTVQHIAAWVKIDEPACHEELPPAELETCYASRGWVKVYHLFGDQGIYEVVKTDLRAMAHHLSYEASTPATSQMADFRRERLRYHGVTDWNGDGDKELLAISEPSDNAATRRYVVSLYDVVSRTTSTLEVKRDDAGETYAFNKTPSQQLKVWLGQRYREFMNPNWDSVRDCRRALDGKLSCDSDALTLQAQAEPTDEADVNTLVERWVERNGRGFTIGKISLAPQPAKSFDEFGPACPIGGNRVLFNVFKGPLLIGDSGTRTVSVLYQQDGDHHREIPLVVIGRDYIWLALSTGRGIIAIRRSDLTAVEAYVDAWRQGIPDVSPYGDRTKPLARGGRKDIQLEELRVRGGRLALGEQPIDFTVEATRFDYAREFAEAKTCDAFPDS